MNPLPYEDPFFMPTEQNSVADPIHQSQSTSTIFNNNGNPDDLMDPLPKSPSVPQEHTPLLAVSSSTNAIPNTDYYGRSMMENTVPAIQSAARNISSVTTPVVHSLKEFFQSSLGNNIVHPLASDTRMFQDTSSNNRDIENSSQQLPTWMSNTSRSLGDAQRSMYDNFMALDYNKRVTVVCMAFVGIFTILFTFFAFHRHPTSNQPIVFQPFPHHYAPVCSTSECVLASAAIINSINPNVDPCDDFYEFSCGKWLNEQEIPPSKFRVSMMDEMVDENFKILKNIMEHPWKILSVNNETTSEHALFNKMHTLYNGCIIEEENHDIYTAKERLNDVLSRVTKHFPISNTEFPTGKVVLDPTLMITAIAQSHEIGVDAFFKLVAIPDPRRKDNYILKVIPSTIGLPSVDDYRNGDLFVMYTKTIVSVFEILLNDIKLPLGKTLVDVAISVAKFEQSLSIITPFNSELEMNSNEEATLGDLSSVSPFLPWKSYFLQRASVFDSNAPLINPSRKFFGDLSELLSKTSPTTIENYIRWRIIQRYSDYSAKPIRNLFGELKEKMTGVSRYVEEPRWKSCVKFINENLGFAVGKWYLDNAFPATEKTVFEEQISQLKKVLINDFAYKTHSQYEWLDQETRKNAVKKISKMRTHIGYPDFLRDPVQLFDHYKELDPTGNFMVDSINILERNIRDGLNKLDQAVDDNEWSFGPSTVGSTFDQQRNGMYLSAGVLRGPLYNSRIPNYINYGSIGSAASSELLHGFDIIGRKYDADGILNDWWTPAASDKFSALSQCFVKQYDRYSIISPTGKEVYVDGLRTLYQNIADNGGLARSFEAWQVGMGGSEKLNLKLPGFAEKYTEEQFYFISNARAGCVKLRPEIEMQQYLSSTLSPARFRINGAVSNSIDFSRAFQCKIGSPMNPQKKCVIW